MRKDREQANILRASGMTYAAIRDRMAVPKSTLSKWFRDQIWSKQVAEANAKAAQRSSAIRLVVLNTVRGSRLKKVYEDAGQDARVDFEELKYIPLFLAGVMAYWAHGDKSSKSRVSMSSSDVKLIRIFILFIENLCGIKNYRVSLILRPNIDEAISKTYWSEQGKVPIEKFAKSTIVAAKKGQKRYNTGASRGVCNVSFSSAYLKHKILKWIELVAADLG